MAVTEKLYETIVLEIARLSILIVEDDNLSRQDMRGMAILINLLSAILAGEQDISDFHDEISESPDSIREYYYKLLYLIE